MLLHNPYIYKIVLFSPCDFQNYYRYVDSPIKDLKNLSSNYSKALFTTFEEIIGPFMSANDTTNHMYASHSITNAVCNDASTRQ